MCKSCCRWEQKFYNYAVTQDDYEAMLAAQGGVCAICSRECELHDHLMVDHHHKSMVFRGLLCHPCNSALGLFQDSTEVLESAARYLRSSRDKR